MTPLPDLPSVVEAAVATLRGTGVPAPRVALVLGSGLGHLADAVSGAHRVNAASLQGYPASTVEGHEGTFILGTLEGVPVVVLKGRIHGYEGHSGPILGLPARILCGLGVEALVLTNAAGGIRPDLRPGDLMLIADHLNCSGKTPLEGANIDAWGPRFPDMGQVYPERLRAMARAAAHEVGVALAEGVYAMMPGPQYETPAEVRMLRVLGADAVGMSTVPEATVARHMGVPVLGVSLISNAAAGLGDEALDHADVLAAADASGRKLGEVLQRALPKLTTGG